MNRVMECSPARRTLFRGAQAARLLVAAARRNELFLLRKPPRTASRPEPGEGQVREGGAAFASRRAACAPQTRRHPRAAILLIAALSVMWMSASARAADPDTFSPVVSYQYQDSLDEPGSQTTIMSPVVSYQYFDWPGDENVTFTNSPNVSYYYDGAPHILAQPAGQAVASGGTTSLSVTVDGSPPLSYQWRINGVAITTNSALKVTNIPSATYRTQNASSNATDSTLTITNADPTQAGAYSVSVSNSYGSASSAPALLNVYLNPLTPQPALPSFNVAGSTPQVELPPATGSLSGSIDPSKLTVVLTHGWNSNSEDWPALMKATLIQKGYATANIVAWDWRLGASSPLYNPMKAASRTPAEGEALGKALFSHLGPNYNQPIHFIGHSFGTLVNCAAANYLHGDSKHRPASLYPWSNTHLTLFDEAEIVQPVNNIFVLSSLLFPAPAVTKDFTYKVVPLNHHYNWIDNYVSEVGILHPEAANVMLWRRWAIPGISDFVGSHGLHGYSSVWYQATINPTGDAPVSTMGHRWSYERNTMGASARPVDGTFFSQSLNLAAPPTSLTPLGSSDANLLNSPQARLIAYPLVTAYQGLYTSGMAVANADVKAIEYAGGVVANVGSLFTPLNGEPIYTGTAGSTPAYYLPATVSKANQAVWDVSIKMQAGASNVQSQSSGLHFTASEQVAISPFVSIPVTVPVEAVGLSFDFMVENAADSDFMAMAIGAENYFTMEAAYIDQGSWTGVPVLDVSAYAGQQINLVFSLNGEGGTNGALQIRGIQFYIPPRPQLDLAVTNNQSTISWPLSSIGWTLEANADLSNPNGWAPINAIPTDADYNHSVTLDITGKKKFFFRLRK
jgi:hypothetical protein